MTKSISDRLREPSRVRLDDSVERLGIISDIHGNLPALQAVLAVAHVDAWLCLGDLVDYATEPNEVCAAVVEHDMLCVLGNHDAYVLGLLEPKAGSVERYRLDWTCAELREPARRFLSGLPTSIEIEVPNSPTPVIRAYHANPVDLERYLYGPHDWASLPVGDSELVAVGHSHMQFLVDHDGGRILNPGSVGLPRDYRPGAAYAVFTRSSGDVELHRVDYDWPAYQDRLRASGVDPKIVGMLSRRRDDEMPGASG